MTPRLGPGPVVTCLCCCLVFPVGVCFLVWVRFVFLSMIGARLVTSGLGSGPLLAFGIPLFTSARRYVKCECVGSAAGNHRGWKWPEDEHWTWCADVYRKKDPKAPPKEPKRQSFDGAVALVAPAADAPPASAVESSARSPQVGATPPISRTEPAPRRRRVLPATFGHGGWRVYRPHGQCSTQRQSVMAGGRVQ